MELPDPAPDGQIYLTTKQAALAMGVARCTVTRWRTIGYLQPLDGTPVRKPLYSWANLVEAEYRARIAYITSTGNDLMVRREYAA